MSYSAPKFELLRYIRSPITGYLAHGVAICSLDGEQLEPILAMRTEDGGLRLSADAVGHTPGQPDVVLHAIYGGRKLSTLTKTQELVLDSLVRAHVEPLIALEDALLDAPDFVSIDSRLRLVRYLPFPKPPGHTCNILGAAQVSIDGKVLEPLGVHREGGELLVSVPESFVAPPGIEFDFTAWPYELRFEDPLLTREVSRQIVALVRDAALRGKAVG